eukprot:4516468-Pyramimonas_sp.AAC.1
MHRTRHDCTTNFGSNGSTTSKTPPTDTLQGMAQQAQDKKINALQLDLRISQRDYSAWLATTSATPG